MKIKVAVADLKQGMFVSELDRPWTETSFLLQGVLINNTEDIARFQESCQYVFVDAAKSNEDIRPHLQTLATKTVITSVGGNEAELADQEQRSFQQELKVARKLHLRTREFIDKALEDSRLGQSVDTEIARELVSEIAASITRSPNAMIWLTHMKERDEYTSTHCMNVCIMSLSFGRCLGLKKSDLEILGLGALLHDIGKMRIPLEILNKPGKLTAEEFEIMKTHPVEGHTILVQQDDSFPLEALDIVKHHHERRNGKGYPAGLEGDLINNLTRIVAIVDVYDAITSDRVYHDAITPYDALKNMYDWINEEFDKDIIENFIKCLGIYPIGSVVELNLGHVGIVVSASEKSKLRPIVLLVQNSKGEIFPTPKLINLAHPKWRSGENKLEIKRILSKHEYSFNIKQIIANEQLL